MDIVCFLAYAIVLCHSWCLLRRESPVLAEFKVGLKKMCRSLLGAHVQGRRRVDVKLQQNMDVLKVHHCRVAMAIASFGFGLMFVQVLAWVGVQSDVDQGQQRVSVTMVYMMALYLPSIVFTFTSLSLTPQRADMILNFAMLSVVIWIGAMNHNLDFFLSAGTRAMRRLGVSLLLLDIRKALFHNVLVSVTVCLKYYDNIGVIHEGNLGPSHLSAFVIIEVGTFIGVNTVACLVQYWLESRIRVMLEVEGARRGMHKLLHTLCDAVLTLGPELRVTDPTPQLLHMLGGCHADGALTPLEGSLFVTHIASESDKQRFHNFISGSSPAAASWHPGASTDMTSVEDEVGLPAVLPVHLQDAEGSLFPVEIFHAYLPDADQHPGHLLGIRVVGELPKMRAPEAPDNTGLPPIQKSVDEQEGSGSTSSAGSTLTELAELIVSADVFCPGMPIDSFTFKFLEPEQAHDASLLPRMKDWLSANEFKKFATWTAQCVNEHMYEMRVTQPRLESIAMQLFATEFHADFVDIQVHDANEVQSPRASHCAEEDELKQYLEAATEDTEEDELTLNAKVKFCFNGFTGYKALLKELRNVSKRRRDRARLPRIQE